MEWIIFQKFPTGWRTHLLIFLQCWSPPATASFIQSPTWWNVHEKITKLGSTLLLVELMLCFVFLDVVFVSFLKVLGQYHVSVFSHCLHASLSMDHSELQIRCVKSTLINTSWIISSMNPMFYHLLESSHWDDSNKWSNIGFGEEINCIEIQICTLSRVLIIANK